MAGTPNTPNIQDKHPDIGNRRDNAGGKMLQGQAVDTRPLIGADVGTQVRESMPEMVGTYGPVQGDTFSLTREQMLEVGVNPDTHVPVLKTMMEMHPGVVSHNPIQEVKRAGGVIPTGPDGRPALQNLDGFYGFIPRERLEAYERQCEAERAQYAEPIPDSFKVDNEGALRDRMEATQEALYAARIIGPDSPTYRRSFDDVLNQRGNASIEEEKAFYRRGGAHYETDNRDEADRARAERPSRGDRRNAPRSSHAMGAGFDSNGRLVRS